MKHFETIWNEAESVAKSFGSLDQKETLRNLRKSWDGLTDAILCSGSIAEYNDAIGQLLFGLCELCAHLEEKHGIVVNSAAALTQAITKRRAEISGPMDNGSISISRRVLTIADIVPEGDSLLLNKE
jgi:hypothetical protein